MNKSLCIYDVLVGGTFGGIWKLFFFVVGGILYSLGWKLFCDLCTLSFFVFSLSFCFSFWIVREGFVSCLIWQRLMGCTMGMRFRMML